MDEKHGTHITEADLAMAIVVAVSPWLVIVCRENSHLENVLMEYL